ncbi:hypothetical protein J2Y69_003504 [Microbacterium resistens]|uniref:Uncharacterized protein n=1 Tax=Microbacterium resistens TaxID=156977 RepID=A0ABU1SHT4_9MICO|nr:hypothetical protein [Microbacterium resistens]MDR6868878.1 hypothetical protein [Microbacterium resistens]
MIAVPMTWNCSELTEADRQKAISENINMCGVLDAPGAIQTKGSSNFGCGTTYIYVDRWFDQIRVSYSLYSSEGIMIGRSLNVYWEGWSNGSNYDFGGVNSDSYSNTVTGANLPGYQVSESAYMSGTVAILGRTITCGVWVEDNPGTI